MPTPYGSHGGMAFSAVELRVLRRALAVALHPRQALYEDVQDRLRLADSIDEAAREGARLRAFLLADLDRYRAALPGTAATYLKLLADAVAAGHRPGADDLAALRALRGNPAAAALLDRCQGLAERDVRARLTGRAVPAGRAHLHALPGGRKEDPSPEPQRPSPTPPRPVPTPGEVFPPKRRPAEPGGPAKPGTPAEPGAPADPGTEDSPADPPQKLAAG